MQIYNTTYVVEPQSLDAFLAWLRSEHQASVNRFGRFSQCVASRVVSDTGMSGVSISVQLYAEKGQDVDEWQAKEEVELCKSLAKKFGQQVLYFSTLMETL